VGSDLLAVIEALTEMIYAIAKKVARPALISVKNLEPFLSCLCPENSSLNRRPTILLATAIFVFSTCILHEFDPEEIGKVTYPTHDSLLCIRNYVVGLSVLLPSSKMIDTVVQTVALIR
jgi:hypothetical protein